MLGIQKDVEKYATEIPTMRAYKLPGGAEAVKTWDLYEKSQVWPDRPYVRTLEHHHANILLTPQCRPTVLV